MAIFITTDGKQHGITHERAVEMWLVLSGKQEASKKQMEFLKDIKDVYMDWSRADVPSDYIEDHLLAIKSLVMNNWMCDSSGNLTQPEPPTTPFNVRVWELTKKYGWLDPFKTAKLL
jgi:hypothetical protein